MNPRRFILGALLTFVAGCGSSAKEYHVSGTVTFNGQPLPKGQIFFDPDVTINKTGWQGYALIDNGRYDTRKVGRGITGGPHIVRIAGFDGKPLPEMPMGSPLFPEYKETRDLSTADSEQSFEVKPASK